MAVSPKTAALLILHVAAWAALPAWADRWWRPGAPVPGSRFKLRTLHGLMPDLYGAARNNSALLQAALNNATPGTTVRVPPGMFYVMGGNLIAGLRNVTFQVDGELRAPEACFDGCWPQQQEGAPLGITGGSAEWGNADGKLGKNGFLHFIQFFDCQHLTITGNGTMDGSGKGWWARYTIGAHTSAKRPKLLVISKTTDLLIENLTFLNSPSFNVLFSAVLRAEVRYITVNTDRNIVRQLKETRRRSRRMQQAQIASPPGRNLFSPLQPEDLNTDGVDPNGKDIWIHDSSIVNDDDSIAVKPMSQSGSQGLPLNCTENILVENMRLTGFGASIGSVSPHSDHNCVRNVTFRNISMPGTGKGVYVKSNPTCDGTNSAEITDILYEDITMEKPVWWPIWIGPQQQQEPGSALGRKCALQYPILNHCPTQGCVSFTNITLRRIKITDPLLSPGVILGNSTHNNMRGLLFEDVVVENPGAWPYARNYQCKFATGVARGETSPTPPCFHKISN